MYELYIGNKNYSSWSLRPWVLLRARDIPFQERLVPFTPGGSFAEFRSFSPSGLVPCLKDGDTTVWDSLGITEYVAERHRGVWPEDRAARAFARCAAAEMHAGFGALRSRCSMNCGIRIRLDGVPPDLAKDLRRLEELWTQGLRRFGGPFLAGAELSAVDAFFAPVAFRIQSYGLQLGQEALAYAARLRDLPAMREWYAAALREPWREPEHEAEILRAGALVADLREPPR